MDREPGEGDEKAPRRSADSVFFYAQRQLVLQQGKPAKGARLQLDPGQQVFGDGFVTTEARRGRLEDGGRDAEFRGGPTRIGGIEGGLSQSPTGIHSDCKSTHECAAYRNYREEH